MYVLFQHIEYSRDLAMPMRLHHMRTLLCCFFFAAPARFRILLLYYHAVFSISIICYTLSTDLAVVVMHQLSFLPSQAPFSFSFLMRYSGLEGVLRKLLMRTAFVPSSVIVPARLPWYPFQLDHALTAQSW